MARVVGLAGGAGLRGSEDGVGETDKFLKTEQVRDAGARTGASKQVADGEVGDSTTWGAGNNDIDSEFFMLA